MRALSKTFVAVNCHDIKDEIEDYLYMFHNMIRPSLEVTRLEDGVMYESIHGHVFIVKALNGTTFKVEMY